MKFYTNLEKFNYSNFMNPYEIHHMYFYMCLLPHEYKVRLLKNFGVQTKSIFDSILNVENEFQSSIEDSDYCLLPYYGIHNQPYNIVKYYEEDIKTILKYKKKILFFYGGDFNSPFNISDKIGIVFRNSGFYSEKTSNVFGCPTFNLDMFKNEYLRKNLSISFCGYPYSSEEGIAKNSKYEGIRNKILKELVNWKYSDFILTESWSNNYTSKSSRLAFFNNLNKNLYGLCVRGGGNFSFRLGEVFMMGRIPILIDTECILPFENEISYDKNTIRITKENSNNFNNIKKVIENYHNSHTENELLEIQRQNRIIWERYFTPYNSYMSTCRLITNINKKKRDLI